MRAMIQLGEEKRKMKHWKRKKHETTRNKSKSLIDKYIWPFMPFLAECCGLDLPQNTEIK